MLEWVDVVGMAMVGGSIGGVLVYWLEKWTRT